jgi:hypothetical protein
MRTTNAKKLEKIKKTITANREKYLRGIYSRLRKASKTASGAGHGRFDFYDYLAEVLKTYWSWEDKAGRKTYGRQFGALFGIPPRKGRSSLHYLIAATSSSSKSMSGAAAKRRQTRDNRWLHGLRFAAKYRLVVEKQGLYKFCYAKNRGGIAGCADSFSAMTKSRKSQKLAKRTFKANKASAQLASGDADDWDDNDKEV